MDRAELEPPVADSHEPLLAHDDVDRLAQVIRLAYRATHGDNHPTEQDVEHIMTRLRIPPTAA